jgi:hypothetical protein
MRHIDQAVTLMVMTGLPSKIRQLTISYGVTLQ